MKVRKNGQKVFRVAFRDSYLGIIVRSYGALFVVDGTRLSKVCGENHYFTASTHVREEVPSELVERKAAGLRPTHDLAQPKSDSWESAMNYG